MDNTSAPFRGIIDLQYDRDSCSYYIIWQPIIIGLGRTEGEALEDLRTAAHGNADTMIDLKLKDLNREKEK
jgi:hypothetical protein